MVFTHVVAGTRPTITIREDGWTWVLAVVAGGTAFIISLAYWKLVQPGNEAIFISEGPDGLEFGPWRPGLPEAVDTAILGPVLEELLFRGAYWALLAAHRPPAFVLIVTSVLFAAGHLAGTPAPMILPPIFAFGVVVGVVRIYSRSAAPCIVSHITVNTLCLSFPL